MEHAGKFLPNCGQLQAGACQTCGEPPTRLGPAAGAAPMQALQGACQTCGEPPPRAGCARPHQRSMAHLPLLLLLAAVLQPLTAALPPAAPAPSFTIANDSFVKDGRWASASAQQPVAFAPSGLRVSTHRPANAAVLCEHTDACCPLPAARCHARTAATAAARSPFTLRSGSLHYFRVPPAYWADRMKVRRPSPVAPAAACVVQLSAAAAVCTVSRR